MKQGILHLHLTEPLTNSFEQICMSAICDIAIYVLTANRPKDNQKLRTRLIATKITSVGLSLNAFQILSVVAKKTTQYLSRMEREK